MTLQIPRIKTALKHVDVHNCWARQTYLAGTFQVEYTPTAQMKADGLTKPLPRQKFETFIQQLGLIDIRALIESSVDSDPDD